FQVGKEDGLVEKSGGLKMGETPPEVGLRSLDDLSKHDEGNVLADHGRGLEPRFLVVGKPVDTRGKKSVHALRELDRLDGTRASIRARLADEGSRVGQAAHALFEEERVAVGPLDQEPLYVGQRRVGADESVEEFVGASRGKGTDLDLRVVVGAP